MDASDVLLTPEAPKGEAFARPSETHPQQGWSLLVIKKQMGETSHSILEVLTKVFGIQESAVGLMALLHELTKDLATLRALIPVLLTADLRNHHDRSDMSSPPGSP